MMPEISFVNLVCAGLLSVMIFSALAVATSEASGTAGCAGSYADAF
jgi:hypothetical protein